MIMEARKRIQRVPLLWRWGWSTLVAYVFFMVFVNFGNDVLDVVFLVALIVGFSVMAGIMVWATVEWTGRSVAILGLAMGDALLYLSFLIAIWDVDPGIREGVRDGARALFVVSIPLMIGSMMVYVNNRRRWKKMGDRL